MSPYMTYLPYRSLLLTKRIAASGNEISPSFPSAFARISTVLSVTLASIENYVFISSKVSGFIYLLLFSHERAKCTFRMLVSKVKLFVAYCC